MANWDDVVDAPVLYKENVTINGVTGNLYLTRYWDNQKALALGSEVESWLDPISINLMDYGMLPLEGDVFIPDYSEHTGTHDALVAAGVVAETIQKVTFGPFNTIAYEIRLV